MIDSSSFLNFSLDKTIAVSKSIRFGAVCLALILTQHLIVMKPCISGSQPGANLHLR